MINLLPPDQADRIRFGRHNAVLRRWLIGAAVAIAGLVLILLVGGLMIDKQSKSYQRSLDASNHQLKVQNLTGVQKDAKEISGNITVINQVLSQEIRFSDLIQEIGRVMPPGTVLGSLSLAKVNGAIDLSVNARDYGSAVQVAANLSDRKNNLFDKVDVINISCTSDNTAYKCKATFKALFSKTAQSRFLNVVKGGQ